VRILDRQTRGFDHDSELRFWWWDQLGLHCSHADEVYQVKLLLYQGKVFSIAGGHALRWEVYQDVASSKHFLDQSRWHRARVEEFVEAAGYVSISRDMSPIQRTDMVDGGRCVGEFGDG
jgi:hypothetical protein